MYVCVCAHIHIVYLSLDRYIIDERVIGYITHTQIIKEFDLKNTFLALKDSFSQNNPFADHNHNLTMLASMIYLVFTLFKFPKFLVCAFYVHIDIQTLLYTFTCSH